MTQPTFRYHPFEIKLDTTHFSPPQKWIDDLINLLPWKTQLADLNVSTADPKSVFLEEKFSTLGADLLLFKSDFREPVPQIAFHDSLETLDRKPTGEFSAICHIVNAPVEEIPEAPDLCALTDFIKIQRIIADHISGITAKTPVLGLVLTGGRSRRMERDKSLLDYHGMPQWEYMGSLLSKHCKNVFLSCRSEQADQYTGSPFAIIPDSILDRGPLGGILSAQFQYPGAAWLVTACDLPYLSRETLEALMNARDPLKIATAFISEYDGLPEPLCAVYEPKSHYKMMQFLSVGVQCPRRILVQSQPRLLRQIDKRSLDNANNPGEYKSARKELSIQHRA